MGKSVNVEFDEDVTLNGVDGEEDLESILESDDPELLEKLFSESGEKVEVKDDDKSETDAGTEVDDDNAGDNTNTDQESEAENKQDEESAASGAEAELDDPSESEVGKKILAKDGENTIPYTVLENARTRAAAAEAKYAEAMEQLSELKNSNKRVSDILKEKGVDLAAIEEGEVISEDQLAKIAEADPDIAKGISVLVNQLKATQAKVTDLESSTVRAPTPVEQAISENNDLSSWREGDPDRWDQAVFYDEQLRADPLWKDKPMSERFAEAVKKTKLLFGDPLDNNTNSNLPPPNKQQLSEEAKAAAAKKIADAASKQTPRSLSDVGAAPNTEKSLTERLLEMSESEIQAQFENLSDAQIEQALANLEFVD